MIAFWTVELLPVLGAKIPVYGLFLMIVSINHLNPSFHRPTPQFKCLLFAKANLRMLTFYKHYLKVEFDFFLKH